MICSHKMKNTSYCICNNAKHFIMQDSMYVLFQVEKAILPGAKSYISHIIHQ